MVNGVNTSLDIGLRVAVDPMADDEEKESQTPIFISKISAPARLILPELRIQIQSLKPKS